jgi:hypothetical protein
MLNPPGCNRRWRGWGYSPRMALLCLMVALRWVMLRLELHPALSLRHWPQVLDTDRKSHRLCAIEW